MRDAIIFGAVFIGGGVFSLALGIREYVRHRVLLQHGVKAKGVARTLTDSDDNVTLMATFVDESGVSRKVYSKGGNTGWTALDGQEVEVLYMRGRPEKARLVEDLRLRTKLSINWFGLLYIAIGAAVIILHFMGFEVLTE